MHGLCFSATLVVVLLICSFKWPSFFSSSKPSATYLSLLDRKWFLTEITFQFYLLTATLYNLIVLLFLSRWLKLKLKNATLKKDLEKCGSCQSSTCNKNGPGIELCDVCNLKDWLKNYHLNTPDSFSLFNEFLEMGRCVWTENKQGKKNRKLFVIGRKCS